MGREPLKVRWQACSGSGRRVCGRAPRSGGKRVCRVPSWQGHEKTASPRKRRLMGLRMEASMIKRLLICTLLGLSAAAAFRWFGGSGIISSMIAGGVGGVSYVLLKTRLKT